MKQNKVLIITSKDDAHADHIIIKLNSLGYSDDVIRINTEDFVHNCEVSFDGASIEVDILDSKRKFNSSTIKSVWYRRPKDFEITTNEEESVKAFIRKQSTAFLRGLYFCCHDSAKWINPLPAVHRSRIKMQQLQLARKIGFTIPDTLITNNEDKALNFFRKHGEICTKSLDEPYFTLNEHLFPMFTRLISDEKELLRNTDSIRRCPVFFQQYINKQLDIRVVVFGARVFAFEIHSQENELSLLDFRGASPHLLRHELHQLPSKIKNLILSFVKAQGLISCSLDLVLTNTGQYYFLENNPNGQWLWLEFNTKTDLTSQMIELLLN